MRIFLTGATGFLGRHVVERLRNDGDHALCCLVRSSSDPSRLARFGVESRSGDIRDPDSVSTAITDAEACIHLAGPSAWDVLDADWLEEAIVEGTRAVSRAVQGQGGCRLVYVSSAAAVGAREWPEILNEESSFGLEDSGLRYALAKRAAEEEVLATARNGHQAIVVNPVETYGPDDVDMVTADQIASILREWPGLAVRGGTSIAHVEDVADGIVRALFEGRPGERYILGGENLELDALVTLVNRLAGRHVPTFTLPRLALQAGVPLLNRLGMATPVPAALIPYLCRYWFVDCTKARTELGYSPRGAEETLKPVVDWLIESGRVKLRGDKLQ